MRQCFTPGGAVDYAAFDASFAQACVGESEDKLCRLALDGLCSRLDWVTTPARTTSFT